MCIDNFCTAGRALTLASSHPSPVSHTCLEHHQAVKAAVYDKPRTAVHNLFPDAFLSTTVCTLLSLSQALQLSLYLLFLALLSLKYDKTKMNTPQSFLIKC